MQTFLEKEKVSKEMKKPLLNETDRRNGKLNIKELKDLQNKYLDTFEDGEK